MGDWELADLLEKHEETSNAELARRLGGEVWERPDALVISSRPDLGSGLNFACRVRSDPGQIDRLVDEVVGWFAHHGIKPTFRVSPLTRPENLAEILSRRGFVQAEAETQMVLTDEDREHAANPHVSVDRVGPEDLDRFVAIQHIGFGGTGEPSPLMYEMARLSIGSDYVLQYLARLDGEAVGAGSLTDWAGAQGIYGVATLPEARGHGVGTALVRRMIRDARERAPTPICLQIETNGETRGWYERLGFRTVYDRTGWTRLSD